MSLVSVWLRLVRRWISSEMSTAESSWTKRSSSMRFSSSATGCSKSRKVVFTSVFYGNRVERAPEVPGGDRAPRPPRFAEPLHRSEGDLPTLEVGKADAFLQPQIVQREYVRTQQVEHEEHLGGPAADATHFGQLLDDRLVVHGRPLVHMDAAVREVLREIGDVFDLAVGQATGAELGSLSRKNRLWLNRGATEDVAIPDALGRLDGDLLA